MNIIIISCVKNYSHINFLSHYRKVKLLLPLNVGTNTHFFFYSFLSYLVPHICKPIIKLSFLCFPCSPDVELYL